MGGMTKHNTQPNQPGKPNRSSLALAINFAMDEAGKDAPEWIELIPAGAFTGRDGRNWRNPLPQRVIDNTVERGVDVPFDVEHSTEIKAPQGEPAPAKSWIKATAENFEVREGAVWARVDWLPAGLNIVKNQEYRYYSPAFYHGEDRIVDGIKSVGFTNTPNLELTALNHEESPMPLPAAIAAALSLNAEATEAEAVGAITTLKDERQTALNRAETPDATKFVPKATYDLALNRAETAEQALKEKQDTELETAINTEVDAAIAAGKVAPASRDFYVASCRAEGGLDAFKAFAASAPKVVADTNLDGNAPDGDGVSLNAEEKLVADQLGISVDEWKEMKESK